MRLARRPSPAQGERDAVRQTSTPPCESNL